MLVQYYAWTAQQILDNSEVQSKSCIVAWKDCLFKIYTNLLALQIQKLIGQAACPKSAMK